MVHYLHQQHKAKEQAEFSRKDSENNPLKKLDWKVTNEQILFEQAQHYLSPPLHWGPGAPPPLAALVGNTKAFSSPCMSHHFGSLMQT